MFCYIRLQYFTLQIISGYYLTAILLKHEVKKDVFILKLFL